MNDVSTTPPPTPADEPIAFHPDNTLFSRHGVEIEYAVVARDSLDVQPVVDTLCESVSGDPNGFEHGPITWTHELVSHVLEFKLSEPAATLDRAAEQFQSDVCFANERLASLNARLLPTGMHPWMDPATETVIWRHEDHEIYQNYHRIFNCRRHGWANLQSVHLNLPFANEDQFRRLHSAIRLLLPLLPALSASSPFREGRRAGWLDTRMETYRTNSELIPSVTGHVVPELILTAAQYRREILERVYHDVIPHDPEGVMEDDWMNARGAIARFERGTIEIRVLDTQECPRADLAIVRFVTAVLRRLVDESICPLERQEDASLLHLAMEFRNVVRAGRAAEITDAKMLKAFGHRGGGVSAGRLWSELLNRIPAAESEGWRDVIEMILNEGSLAERILRAAGEAPGRDALRSVYRRLADCLDRGELFV